MIKGLDVFRLHFEHYTDRYVLIGGVAATLAMEEAGLDFRATKDIDLVLVVEAMDAEFGQHFWQFVKDGGYQVRERSEGKPHFYRFQKPMNLSFPVMLELFSRMPDGLALSDDAHLTPIPLDEAVSSLSAILLDDDYYAFILAGATAKGAISWVGPDRLIPLKANAWLDLSARQQQGEAIDHKNVRKHLNDVVRLSQLLSPAMRIDLPVRVAEDLNRFLGLILQETVDLKSMGLGQTNLTTIVDRIREAYPPGTACLLVFSTERFFDDSEFHCPSRSRQQSRNRYRCVGRSLSLSRRKSDSPHERRCSLRQDSRQDLHCHRGGKK